jgi:hypothetical protein
MIGIHSLTHPVAAMPQIASVPIPFCQTSTITPHAAATESRFRTTAWSGSTSERKARARSTNVSAAISAIVSGKWR